MKWFLLLLIPLVHAKSDLQIYHGVIAATADGEEAEVNKFCVTFNPDWFTTVYTNNVQDALKYPLYRIHLVINGCDEVTDNLTNTSVVIIDTGECSVVNRAKNLVNAGAELMVSSMLQMFISQTSPLHPLS